VVQQEWDGPEDGARVHAVDITDPFAPRLITTISLADLTVQLDLEGDRLLVTSGRRVRFYDVSDEVPKLYGMLTVADESAGPAALQGHHAYVVDGHTLHVADFGAFGRPRWVGQLQLGVGEPTALAVSGTRALVATSQGPDEGAAIVIDITDPGAPRVAGSITDVGDNITSVTLDGTRAVIATGHAVDLWDVSDRAAPARVARLEAGAGRFFADYQVWAVSVEGDRAWLAAGQAGVVVARLPGAGVRLALPAVHVGRSRE
jgi:hypothetical protein